MIFELIQDLVDYFTQHKYRSLWPIVLMIFGSMILAFLAYFFLPNGKELLNSLTSSGTISDFLTNLFSRI